MPEKENRSVGERLETAREDRDKLFSELETKLLATVRSRRSDVLSRKTIEEIESMIDEYYNRWKQ
jgi:hypothetical protein